MAAFVGRERELAALAAVAQQGSRHAAAALVVRTELARLLADIEGCPR